MATFSDGEHEREQDTNIMADHDSQAISSAGDMRMHLQLLLDSKEKQLQHAGTLGQRVLAQQMELEERIRQLQDMDIEKGDDDEIGGEMRRRYRELAETLQAWDDENAKLSSAFGAKTSANGIHPSPSYPNAELPPENPVHPSSSGPTPAQSSRRAKNAAHRANDVEFALDIGNSLLTEVRRLQSLLGERDKAIQDMKEEKDDLEKAVEGLRSALRTQEQSADKYKEENWNLEVTLQDLRTQLSDSQGSAQRAESETKRLTKLLNSSRETGDTHKNESERLKSALDDLKARHETDVAQARKHAAGLAREKSDLLQTLDTYKVEIARAGRRLPRFGSPLTPGASGVSDAHTPAVGEEDDDDPFSVASTGRRKMDNSSLFPPDAFGSDYADSSPEPSPSRPFMSPNHPSNEIEALQQKLSHAQRQIATLKGTLQREKELRMEYRRKLNGGDGLVLGGDENDLEEEEDADTDEGARVRARPRAAPTRGRGRGSSLGTLRNGRRLTLAQKLGWAANSPPSEFTDDDNDEGDISITVPPIITQSLDRDQDQDQYLGSGDEEDEHAEPARSPSPPQSLSNRTSVDGMDPAFANVLRHTSSPTSIPQNSSPLRKSIVARTRGDVETGTRRTGATAGRRNRGGAAFQEARPSSLVGQPEALADELGLGLGAVGMDSVEEGKVLEPKETSEFGCQTDFVEQPVPTLPPVQVRPDTMEIGVQVDPEPAPAPVVEMCDASLQTDTVLHADVGIVTDAPVLPVMVEKSVSAIMSTSESETQTPSVRVPIMADIETQTSPVEPEVKPGLVPFPLPDLHGARRRITLTQSDYSTLRNLNGDASVSAASPPRRAFLHNADEEDWEDAGEVTETGADDTDGEGETETDTDDYQDARASIGPTATPTDSMNDFHSISTLTDNDFSDNSDDGESIKASRLGSGSRIDEQPASAQSSLKEVSLAELSKPAVLYESQSVGTDTVEEPQPPKKELKEMAMQTDEWVPPAPVSMPVPSLAPAPPITPAVLPAAATGFGLYRVGSNGQQFQFVSPSSASAPPTAISTPISRSHSPTPGAQRDSSATISSRPPMRFPSPSLASRSDRRQSIESTLSHNIEDAGQTLSVTAPVDKSRPPTMMLPPPPRMPPPPNSMPPPNFIPDHRRPTTSMSSRDREIPPPRPTSPPPPELIQRATTPTFGAVLTVPGARGGRQHGSSLPPMAHGLRQPPSTTSFRSAANAASHAQLQHAHFASGSKPGSENSRDRHLRSTTSLLSDQEDIGSRRSSMSSEHFHPPRLSSSKAGPSAVTHANNAPTTPSRTNTSAGMSMGMTGSTDPTIIHAITQTMIGEFLYKYTRKTIGKGHGERRHKRFFWVHPYTKTLYWSSADPGSSNVSESSAKSAYIDSVRSVMDPNPMPPGLHQYSVVISTPQREMKFTAPTKERHDIWLNALQYLLARPTPVPTASPAPVNGAPASPARHPTEDGVQRGLFASPQSQRSARSAQTGISGESAWNVTPRGQRSQSQLSIGGSVGKRSGTPAAEYLRWADAPISPSIRSGQQGHEYATNEDDDDDLDFEIHDSTLRDNGFEGLENVRACCDGRHTVGKSGFDKDHHHHHHHHDIHNREHVQNHDRPGTADILQPDARPASPAWSFRSRASSNKSQEGGTGSLFSRFGSRRSARTAPVTSQE